MAQSTPLFIEQACKSWADAARFVVSLSGTHVFRGQTAASWPLQSTIERASSEHDKYQLESSLLRAFQTGASRFLTLRPTHEDMLSWLALMQHHGVPTRLLDWTRSPFVAAFFAAEGRESVKEPFSIWAIELRYLRATARALLSSKLTKPLAESDRLGDAAIFNGWLQKKVSVVAPVASPAGHDRLLYQRGLFLCPGHLEQSFDVNLGTMVEYSKPHGKRWFCKITIPFSERVAALRELDAMNINRASLFPGLDGYSQYLRQKIELLPPTRGRRIENYGRSPDLAEFELL